MPYISLIEKLLSIVDGSGDVQVDDDSKTDGDDETDGDDNSSSREADKSESPG